MTWCGRLLELRVLADVVSLLAMTRIRILPWGLTEKPQLREFIMNMM